MRKPVYAICEQQRCRLACSHPRRLISAFVVRCLDSIIPLVSIPEISSLYLASVAAQANFNLPWLKVSEDRFSCDEAHFVYFPEPQHNNPKIKRSEAPKKGDYSSKA